MDWKTIGNCLLLVGLFVVMVTMFNQVNGRIEALSEVDQAKTKCEFLVNSRLISVVCMPHPV